MFKYRYDYKFLKLKTNSLNVIIELGKDNTLGKMVYSAKTNLMVQDEYGDWGHMVGVGDNEKDALEMCLTELKQYLNISNYSIVEDLEIPTKIVYDYKKQTIVLNIEQDGKNYSVLTPNGRKNIITDDIISYISLNLKEFINDSIENYSQELFEKYKFNKPFDFMTEKYSKTINM